MLSKPFRFSGVGVAAGLLCVATLYLIEIYGPGSYSSSGSGVLMADGTVVVIASNQPMLPRIAQAAFFAFSIPLVLGVVAVFRKENIYWAVGSFCLGLAPILIYTVGVFFSSMVYFGISLPAFGIYAFKRMKKT